MHSYNIQYQPTSVYLLDKILSLIPGIRKAVCIMYNELNNEVECYNYELNHSIEKVIVDGSEDYDLIVSQRKTGLAVEWLRKQDLPFSIDTNIRLQREMFDEVENNVLRIRVINHFDRKSDIFFFYINSDSSNFGLKSGNSVLSTENKSIISTIILNSIDVLREARKKSDAEKGELKRLIKDLSVRYKHERQKLKDLKDISGSELLKLGQIFLSKFAGRNNITASFTPEAQTLIKESEITIELFETVIEKAFEIAILSSSVNELNHLLIEDWHLDFEVKISEEKVIENRPDSRYLKTITLLDKLEGAAIKALGMNLDLTSVNVGKSMEKPISAPAITDALRKHGKKIISLLEKNPDKWITIRKEFRPLLNIIDNHSSQLRSNSA